MGTRIPGSSKSSPSRSLKARTSPPPRSPPHTGRTKFLKFEGHYHGWYDPYCLKGHSHPIEQLGPPENPAKIPDSEGIPPSVFDDVIIAPWNDLPTLESILRREGRDLAAIITEPIMANMGCIPPRDGYLP